MLRSALLLPKKILMIYYF